jgi:hypothetical protein
MKITSEDLEALAEMMSQVDGYKVIFDKLVDTYGKDVEEVFIRVMKSSAKVQKVYYDSLVKEGFSSQQAFTLLLDARNAIRSMNLSAKT